MRTDDDLQRHAEDLPPATPPATDTAGATPVHQRYAGAAGEATADAEALRQQLQALRKDKQELERKRYVDAALSYFTDTMRLRVDSTLETWSSNLLEKLVPYVEGLQGALYMLDYDHEPALLRRIGGYALPADAPETFEVGKGLAGQVARMGEELSFTAGDQFRAHTTSSLAQIEANSLFILPLIQNEVVEGVLELTSVGNINSDDHEFLRKLADTIAANLVTLRNQTKISALLQDAQEQKEQLQSQEEEMRQNMEELEATQEQMMETQNELSRNEQRLKSLMDSIPVGIHVIDSAGNGYYLNAAAKSMVLNRTEDMDWEAAISLDEMGTTFNAKVAGTDDPYPVKNLPANDALQGAAAMVDDLDVVTASGSRRSFVVRSTPILDDEGGIEFVISTFIDVTQQKKREGEIHRQNEELAQREEELRQNLEELEATQEQMQTTQAELQAQTERFGLIGENMPGLLFQYRLDLESGRQGFSYVTSRTHVLFGQAPEALEGVYATETPLDLHPEDAPSFEANLRHSAEHLAPFEWRGRIKDGEGNFHYLDVNAVPRLDEERTAIYWDGYMDDRTREEEHRQEAKREKALADNILAGAGDLILAVDRDFRVLRLSRQGNRMIDATEKGMQMKGMHYFDLVPESERQEKRRNFERVFAGESFETAVRLPREGGDVYQKMYYYPLRDEADAIVGGVAIGRDETAAEQEQQQLQAELDALKARQSAMEAVLLVLEFDADEIICRASEPLLKALGYDRAELAGQPASTILPADEASKVTDALAGKAVSGPLVLLSRSGETLQLQGTFQALPNGTGGQPEGVLFTGCA